MIGINAPFDDDPADIIECTAADRVGSRIREIRIARGLSQPELGRMVDLSADRVQQYENGFRKPKMNLIKAFASALGVSTLALIDPVVTNDLGVMYALFEMERTYNIDVDRSDHTYSVIFNNKNRALSGYLDAWYKAYSTYKEEMKSVETEEERKAATTKYNDFKWTFPNSLSDQTSKELRKLEIQEKIEELKRELKDLQDDGPA